VNFYYFEINWTSFLFLLPAAILAWILYSYNTKAPQPKILVSDIQAFSIKEKSFKEKFSPLSKWLFIVGLASLAIAFLDIRIFTERPKKIDLQPGGNLSVEGIALYLVLDQSGSMKETVSITPIEGLPSRVSKIDLLKYVTKLFVQGDKNLKLSGRPNDLIGLVEFARGAHVIVPLTLDHQVILEKLNNFNAVEDKNQDGTAIGYAIFKTANLIVATRNYAKDLIGQGKPAYEIKNSVILLITDGLQDPNPLDNGKRWRQIDPIEAAQFAKDNNIRLYIVNVEPSLATSQFEANLNQMRKAAELTGGQFFIVNRANNLLKIYESINALEKSSLPLSEELKEKIQNSISKDELPNLFKSTPLYPYFIGFGMCCLFFAIVLETLILKRFP